MSADSLSIRRRVLTNTPLFPPLVYVRFLQVRFDSDAELDLAIRTSPSPLRVVAHHPRGERPATTAMAPAMRTSSPAAPAAGPLNIPSTQDYAVTSSVRSVTDERIGDDIIMVDFPREAGVSSVDSGDILTAGNKPSKSEIDALTAFEAEMAAARDPEGSELYRKATIRLARRNGVHLTPTLLWRLMALLQLQGRQLVRLGLAPHRVLEVSTNHSLETIASSDEEANANSKNGKRRGGGMGRGKSWSVRWQVVSPIQRMLERNGIPLPEAEVMPLLEVLRVRPRRLVKLELLTADEMAGLQDGDHDRPSAGERGQGGPLGRDGGRFGHGGGGGRGLGPPFPLHHMHHPPYPMDILPEDEGGYHHPSMSHMLPPDHAAAHSRAHMFGGHGYPHHAYHPHYIPLHPPFGIHGDEHGGEADRHAGPPLSSLYAWHGHSGVGFGNRHDFGRGYGGGGGGGRQGCGGRGGRDYIAMARFVEHRSPSPGNDVAHVYQGQNFKKSWLVRNDSSISWPEDVSLVPVSRSCEDLSSPPEAAVVGAVAPGEAAEVSVDLVAPLQTGMYEGLWRPCGGERKFGQRLWAKVMVMEHGSGDGAEVDAGVKEPSVDDRHKDNQS